MKNNYQLKLKRHDFQELLTTQGLINLDQDFLSYLQNHRFDLYGLLLSYRQNPQFASEEQLSQLLIEIAQDLENFISELFGIEEEAAILQAETVSHNPIFAFKTYYVMRLARRYTSKIQRSFHEINQSIIDELLSNGLDIEDAELAISHLGQIYLKKPETYQTQTEQLIQWCYLAINTPEGQETVKNWQMFKLPKPLNFKNLVPVRRVEEDEYARYQGMELVQRDGFNLTDSRMTQRQAMDEVAYCVYCHKNQGDFCSRGFPVKKTDPKQGLKIDPAGNALTGCPLEERISEMHVLKRDGFGIGALAMVMRDNPMCPVTGHRICNDCMKACIYQKQDPVDIPQTETRVLTDVLDLPWGVEIYDLLTRWNPLRPDQWLMKPYNGLKVLVMGMGPAGFSLAHHLLMEGFAVVGMDGLKIEPISGDFISHPIYSFKQLKEQLADRLVTGFGGVAEYGITVRWDKNFLKLIYLSLLRKPAFQIFGNVRFGGTIEVEDAWSLGFDHFAVAVGAGLPKELNIPNSLASGMRQANDFLMSLQLTGASKKSSMANLQVRMPVVVIGGGLTAVDTATEVQAYYLVQVEKATSRYQELIAFYGENYLLSQFSSSDLTILNEFIAHGREVIAERLLAQQQNRSPDFISLIRKWGGVTIAYRRTMQESPAYRRNHEELTKALEQGIYYAEGLEPVAALLDEQDQVKALQCRWSIWDETGQWIPSDEQQAIPARTILVATGARLNVAYEFEHRGTFLKQDRFEYRRYEHIHGHLRQVDNQGHVKMPHFGAFTSYTKGHRTVTFLGDAHPIFHGNVVNAIASAKRVYPEICRSLKSYNGQGNLEEYRNFRGQMDHLFNAKLIKLKRHNPSVVELIVKAPMAAKKNKAGQFYRLQNFEYLCSTLKGTALQMEALPLLSIGHAEDPELLSFFIIERGVSSRLAARLNEGDPVALMGPTGSQFPKLRKPSKILIIGDIFSPILLFSVKRKFLEEGHEIWYLGYFHKSSELYCKEQIQSMTEKVIWVSKEGCINAERSQDQSFMDLDLINALQKFDNLATIDQVWIIGSHCLLEKIQQTQANDALQLWPKGTNVMASVYGPMQCMLKGVCAQCLQWQINPITGARSKAVYACSWQHQSLGSIDVHNIEQRLSQNHCQETLNNLWLDYILSNR